MTSHSPDVPPYRTPNSLLANARSIICLGALSLLLVTGALMAIAGIWAPFFLLLYVLAAAMWMGFWGAVSLIAPRRAVFLRDPIRYRMRAGIALALFFSQIVQFAFALVAELLKRL